MRQHLLRGGRFLADGSRRIVRTISSFVPSPMRTHCFLSDSTDIAASLGFTSPMNLSWFAASAFTFHYTLRHTLQAFPSCSNKAQSVINKLHMSSGISTTSFQIVQLPCLGDNYGYLLHDDTTGQTAAIDTPESKVYKEELQKRNWKLTHIFNTHHHWDHVGGNMDLKSDNVKIYGPINEKEKIPGIDVSLAAGDAVSFGTSTAQIIDVGGHTKGHIAYYFPQENVVFVGDSLFSLGCGRMFEGTPHQFWESLNRLRSLPDNTLIYCAHEYTENNAKFAMSVEPQNQDLIQKVQQVRKLRESQLPTIPCRLGDEKKTNPFLRVDFSSEIRKNIMVQDDDDDALAFYKLRLAKDKF